MSNPILDAAGHVVYEPWPGPQQTFWDFKGRYGLYGGSGFTGKTDLLRWYPWQQIQAEDVRLKQGDHMEQSTGHALVLRRETPQLRELMNRCRRDFERTNSSIHWHAKDNTWEWPNGYRYTVGHMDNEEDWMKYQGWQISCLCLDEGTTFTEKQFSMIDAWVRQPKGSYLTPIIRIGSNPVGVGLKWVRKFFVEAGYEKDEARRYWGKPIVKELSVPVVDDTGNQTTEKRKVEQIFVPARVSDNKSVDQGDYAATLVNKPEYVRRAILEGDWYAIPEDAWAAGLFIEGVHIVKPFTLPKGWWKFRSGHFGNAWPQMSSFLWWAVTPNDDFVCYRSLSITGVNAREQARMIKGIEMDNDEWDSYRDCSKLTGLLSEACFYREGDRGPTIEETFRNEGILWSKATKNLEHAAEQIRIRLQKRTPHRSKAGVEIPGIRFFDTCWNYVKPPDGDKVRSGPVVTIPTLPKDEKKPEIWVKNGWEHDMNALAYACASRPNAGKDVEAVDDDELAEIRLRAQRADASNPWASGGYIR